MFNWHTLWRPTPGNDDIMLYITSGFSYSSDGVTTGLCGAQTPSQVHECIWQKLFGDLLFRKGKLQGRKETLTSVHRQPVSLLITPKCFSGVTCALEYKAYMQPCSLGRYSMTFGHTWWRSVLQVSEMIAIYGTLFPCDFWLHMIINGAWYDIFMIFSLFYTLDQLDFLIFVWNGVFYATGTKEYRSYRLVTIK